MNRNMDLAVLSLSVSLAMNAGLREQQISQTVKGWGTVVDPDGACKFAMIKVFSPQLDELKITSK
jgi:hypothetical protein